MGFDKRYNLYNFKSLFTMEEIVDEEISFLESSCEQLRKEIERYSTPLDRRAQARDSGIATLVGAIGDQSHATDDTVVLQGNEQSGNLVERASNEHVTVRPAKAQHRNGRSETELADALYNYSLRNDEHPVMVSAQRGARAPSIVNASDLLANAPNDRQRDFHNSAQTHSLGAGTRNLINENRLREEFDHGIKGSRCNIKPATFDGSNYWLDYKSHFDACATYYKQLVGKRERPVFSCITKRDSSGRTGKCFERNRAAL